MWIEINITMFYGDGDRCCGTTAAWIEKIDCDSRRNAAVFDFYGAPAVTIEATIQFFHMQNFRPVLMTVVEI